jgi:hypothetical protein
LEHRAEAIPTPANKLAQNRVRPMLLRHHPHPSPDPIWPGPKGAPAPTGPLELLVEPDDESVAAVAAVPWELPEATGVVDEVEPPAPVSAGLGE